MGLLETTHAERKARLKRIAEAAYKPPEPSPVQKLSDIKQEVMRLRLMPSLDIILHELCRYYNMRAVDIMSSRRQTKIAERRQILMYLANKLTTLTNPQLGEKLGKDPTTIWHGVTKIQSNIEKYQEDLDKLETLITEAFRREGCRIKKT